MGVLTYWAPIPLVQSRSVRFDELKKHGALYELKRQTGFVRSFLFGDENCDISAGYNSQDRDLVVLVASQGIDHFYLSKSNKEFLEVKMHNARNLAKVTLSEFMSARKKILIERMNYRGVSVNEVRFAKTNKMGLENAQQLIFQRALDEILDKYLLEPD